MKSFKVTQNSEAKYLQTLFLIVLGLAVLASRFYGLTFKPVHFDEGINGWFSSQVAELGYYKYDPNNYHGPLYFYVLRFFEIVFGKSITTLRAVPSLFAVLSVMLFALPSLGGVVWRRWVMGLLLISPAFIFFGRSGIHEMPFVFFQLVFAMGILRSLEEKDGTALNCLMIGLFGMITLKETFAVTLFSFAMGLLALGPKKIWELVSLRDWKQAWTYKQSILLAILLWAFLVMFTGFFKNFAGLIDFFRAFLPWMKTGVHGNGHDKYFFYWIDTLWQAEPLVLLGVLLAMAGVFSHHRGLKLISVFSLVQLFVYSAIPYKTVWCILSLVWGFYLVIAYHLANTTSPKLRWGLMVAVFFGGLFNLWSSYESSYRNPINLDHRYVYVNSTYEVNEVIDFLLQNNPEKTARVQVGMVEQWPWPWLLRDFPIVSYEGCMKSFSPELEIYFCDKADTDYMDQTLAEAYWKAEFEFRQEKGASSYVYLKKSVFPTVPFKRVQEIPGKE
ncbi:hypothetical protein AZI86_17935 [Bdellovibrio bacteriovorus]|uniref:Mannosyltransferase n=1 Tax=Bdellovibrio bacteriovorus TaxID=959 RepID=A0A150WF56_BDEBC|nr:hypothetical protein [Bdellovibrio bacteriovorus]KYG61584.1 hypothetical protein AZI86_17935 [Bdellovibrio bacteriovorus]